VLQEHLTVALSIEQKGEGIFCGCFWRCQSVLGLAGLLKDHLWQSRERKEVLDKISSFSSLSFFFLFHTSLRCRLLSSLSLTTSWEKLVENQRKIFEGNQKSLSFLSFLSFPFLSFSSFLPSLLSFFLLSS